MEELTVEQRRCERLRNLLSPAYTLAQFVQEDNVDGKLDKYIKNSADRVMEVWPMIEKALDPNVTIEELNQLYSEPENRR